ncbi:hypothetical protein [Burkholderia glumae]|uniref:hypothetical protein n=1 Tax=Burkholderia glumae TaxID=337 RepID=UPI0021509D53|nr:hypothetical protein [Burkholderia glumae]
MSTGGVMIVNSEIRISEGTRRWALDILEDLIRTGRENDVGSDFVNMLRKLVVTSDHVEHPSGKALDAQLADEANSYTALAMRIERIARGNPQKAITELNELAVSLRQLAASFIACAKEKQP